MDEEYRVIVEPADDWESYSRAWTCAMEHHYWFQESPVFDFNRHEEIEEIRTEFGKSGNLFLTAKLQDQDDIIGVLGCRYRNVMARIRRWEPAVIPEYQESNVAEALLTQALDYLASMGVKRIGCLMKHPINSPESVERHRDLYLRAGLERSRPDSIDMVRSLVDISHPSNPPQGVQVETGENYEFEDLASIVVKSFTSTEEEREIHGFDKTVTEHIQATALLQRMAEGFYGYSSDEFRKIVVVEGIPVGFLGAFIVESKYQPLTGVLGPMAVLPNFRKRGIATYLVNQILWTLKEHECEFAVVGTPAANTGAIVLYEKAGFCLASRIINLERTI